MQKQCIEYAKKVLDAIHKVGAPNMNQSLIYEATYARMWLEQDADGPEAEYCEGMLNVALSSMHRGQSANTYRELLLARDADLSLNRDLVKLWPIFLFRFVLALQGCVLFAVLLYVVHSIMWARILVAVSLCVALCLLWSLVRTYVIDCRAINGDTDGRVSRALCMLHNTYGQSDLDVLVGKEFDRLRKLWRKYKYDDKFYEALVLTEQLYNKEVRHITERART